MMQLRRAQSLTGLHRAGFTLLELLLVCGVIVALSALLWPSAIGWLEADRLSRTADDLRGLLIGLRVRAMEEGTEYVFSFQPGSGSYRIARLGGIQESAPPADAGSMNPDAKPRESFVRFDSGQVTGSHSLVEGIEFAIDQSAAQEPIGSQFQVSAADASGTNWTAIEFKPDGTTADASFELVDRDGMGMTFQVRGLTGVVKVSRVKESNHTASSSLPGAPRSRRP